MATIWDRLLGRTTPEAAPALLARAGSLGDRDAEQGTTGTPNVGGYIVGEDYNPKLDGHAAMQVYDEMRRSDGQAQSILLALKLPLKSATWRVDPPDDAQPAERELADFCQCCLFDVGAMRDTWSYVLDHLLLKLDFGHSVLERIWTLGEDGKVRLKRLAPRLPPTIARWILDPTTSDLTHIEQQAWKNGQFGTFLLNADRCVVSVNNREGDNYYGRALALDTPIPTPDGWKVMGELRVGDMVFDEQGAIRHVTAVSEVWKNRPCYRVTFGDGTSIVADENHQWVTQKLWERSKREAPKLRTTREIAKSVKDSQGVSNHSIPWARPLQYVRQHLHVSPWVLGLWLGDGTSLKGTIACHAADLDETVARLTEEGYETAVAPNGTSVNGRQIAVYGLSEQLRALGVFGNKHVPEHYLRGDTDQRRALLTGLMDSDGCVSKDSGQCQFSNTDYGLIQAVAELVRSLGVGAIVASTCSQRRLDKGWRPSWEVRFTPPWSPFTLLRKSARTHNQRARANHYIWAIDAVDPQDTVCIEVDAPSHLFLAGEAMVPTHNSVLRSAYLHWHLKTQLYRIDAVKHDRYGVGVPEAILDKDTTFAPDELTAIDTALKNLSAKERAYIRHSSKVEYKIMTPAGGTGGTADLMASVEHHNAMIARTALAGFMSQGEQKHGSYGMGSRLTDFFANALESVADDTCNDLNLRVIKALCDLNFPMQDRRYPHLAVANISDVDVQELCESLKTLGSHITAEDDLEDVLRKLMNLPALPAAMRGRDRTPKPPPIPGAPSAASTPPEDDDAPPARTRKGTKRDGTGDKGGDDDEDPDEGDAPASLARPRASVHRLSAGYVTANGYVLGRAPTALEFAIFSVEDVPAQLEAAAEGLAREMAAVRRTQLDAVLAEVVRKDAKTSTGDFTDIRPSEIRLPGIKTLTTAIRTTQSAVAAYGADQVALEQTRQGVTSLAMFDAVDASRKAATSALVSSAQVAAERMSDTWYGRILETVLSERRSGKQGDALKAAVTARLAEDVEKAPVGEARAEVNEAFAIGRAGEAAARKDDIETVQYSALLDQGTCVPCAALDGAQFAFQSAEYYRTLPPYSGCEGNRGRPDACRCVHLYLFRGRTV